MKNHNSKFRRILPVAVLAALGTSTLVGVIQPVLAEKPAGSTARMKKIAQELGLTATQKTRLQTIMTQTRQQSKAVRNNKSLSQTQKRERMRAIHQASRQRMSNVLTIAQRKKLMGMRSEHRSEKSRSMRRKM